MSRFFRGRENRSPSSSPDSVLPERLVRARGFCGLMLFRKEFPLITRQRSQHGNLPELQEKSNETVPVLELTS
jgi:hypothetical protein